MSEKDYTGHIETLSSLTSLISLMISQSTILLYTAKCFIDVPMFVGTHAMLPVVIATAGDIVSTATYRKRLFSASDRWAFAICGILPDILRPHIGLSSRLTSFSHTLWFALIALPIILILSYIRHSRNFIRFGMFCWFAILLHLFCDMIAGGIAPLYPLIGTRIGFYHIQPKFWILLDVLTIFLFLAELVLLKTLETENA